MKKIMYLLLICAMLVFMDQQFPAHAEEVTPAETVAPAPGVQTVEEYKTYLNNNYGTLDTGLKVFDLRDKFNIIENADEFKCYDIAVSINIESLEGWRDVTDPTVSTAEQRDVFWQSLKNYQEHLSKLTEATFPGRKIRGGFITIGYKYPNLKMGPYEFTRYGWKNYSYKEKILNFYDDTYVYKLDWYEFGDTIHNPLDLL